MFYSAHAALYFIKISTQPMLQNENLYTVHATRLSEKQLLQEGDALSKIPDPQKSHRVPNACNPAEPQLVSQFVRG